MPCGFENNKAKHIAVLRRSRYLAVLAVGSSDSSRCRNSDRPWRLICHCRSPLSQNSRDAHEREQNEPNPNRNRGTRSHASRPRQALLSPVRRAAANLPSRDAGMDADSIRHFSPQNSFPRAVRSNSILRGRNGLQLMSSEMSVANFACLELSISSISQHPWCNQDQMVIE